MNLRDLKYLISVAEHGHFGKAAKICFISQPALSMQIKKLEESLGVQLLERTNKSVLLTDIGKIICERAKNILFHTKEIHDIARQSKDPLVGEVHIGIIPTVAPYLLPHIIPGLSKIFPKLTLYLVEAQTSQLLEKLKLGKLDVGLLALPLNEPELVTVPLFEEEFMLAVHHHHPLSKRKIIKYTDLENLDLLLLEEGHCMREQALAVCHRASAAEAKSFQATSLETLRYMVASQAGITLMPRLSCKTNDGISYLPFNAPKPTRTVGLIWRTSSARKILLDKLTKELKKLIAKQINVRVMN
jgi:LysR family hydrogen peroxide-inducible transcriptional activator